VVEIHALRSEKLSNSGAATSTLERGFCFRWLRRPPQCEVPLVVYQDHYHAALVLCRLSPLHLTRKLRARRLDNGYRFFQDWTAGRLPRVIMIYVQNANPYYDDSYDVDSANVGPYGSAINEELIRPSSRSIAALARDGRAPRSAVQQAAGRLWRPRSFIRIFTTAPGPPARSNRLPRVSEHRPLQRYQRLCPQGDFAEIPIAGDRKPDGTIVATAGGEFGFEYVLGTHGRSTEQWNIWQAVFSRGPDGYPAHHRSVTGDIDKKSGVLHDHYDLTAILKRDCRRLAPTEGNCTWPSRRDTYFLTTPCTSCRRTRRDPQSPFRCDIQYARHAALLHSGPAEYTMQQNNPTGRSAFCLSWWNTCWLQPRRRRHEVLEILRFRIGKFNGLFDLDITDTQRALAGVSSLTSIREGAISQYRRVESGTKTLPCINIFGY